MLFFKAAALFALVSTSQLVALSNRCEFQQQQIDNLKNNAIRINEITLEQNARGTRAATSVTNVASSPLLAIFIEMEITEIAGPRLFTLQTSLKSKPLPAPQGFDNFGDVRRDPIQGGETVSIDSLSAFRFVGCRVHVRISRIRAYSEARVPQDFAASDWQSEIAPLHYGIPGLAHPDPSCRHETVVNLTVDEKGSVSLASAKRSCEWLETLVKSWRFNPALASGKPIRRSFPLLIVVDKVQDEAQMPNETTQPRMFAIVNVFHVGGDNPYWDSYWDRRSLTRAYPPAPRDQIPTPSSKPR